MVRTRAEPAAHPGGVPEAVRAGARPAAGYSLAAVLLLWLAGINMRLPLLVVPPMLPAIHRDLHLGETLVGVLSAMPVFLLALAAVPGSLLVARLGARQALILGLLLVGGASAARGVGTSAGVLLAMTFLTGVGIAASQPSLPALARQWCPGRLGVATAVYANGFLVGEILGAALTIPLVLPLAGGHWQIAFPLWATPVALTVLGLLAFTSGAPRPGVALPARWWPDWRNGATWRLGLVLGCASITYFGSNAFIPDYLRATDRASLINPALTALNIAQLPASLLLAIIPGRLIARRWPLIVCSISMLVGAVGLLVTPGAGVVAWAAVLGFSAGQVFVLSLALPAVAAEPGDAHRLSAAMFTIAYSTSALGALLIGAAWDLTGRPAVVGLPVIVAALAMGLLAWGTAMPRTQRAGAQGTGARP